MATRTWILFAALACAAPAQEAGKPPAHLGVRVGPIDAETRAAFGIPEGVTEGVVILDAFPDTAAARAGFRRGDVLVRFAGAPVRTTEELIARVRANAPGAEVGYVLRRGDGTIDGRVRLGAAAPEPPPDPLERRLDRVQKDIEELQRRLHGPRTIADWRRAEERSLEAVRARGDREAARRAEIRLELLREMEAEGVRGLEERVDRLERKIDRVLERLGER